MSRLTVVVDLDMWRLNHKVLMAARDNASDLLNDHLARLGQTTTKNKLIADSYVGEIKLLNKMLDYSARNGGLTLD